MLRNIKARNLVLSIILEIIGFSFIFLGGSFSSNSYVEKVAQYATAVVKNNTMNKRYCCVSAQKSNDSGSLPDPDSEFHNLYGVFRQEKMTFASTINTHKEHDIFITDHTSDSLSMLYVGPTGTIEYKGHYKHYITPIEVMFEDGNYLDTSKYIAYISKTQADTFLRNGNPDKDTFTSQDYYSLLNKKIQLTIDGAPYDFVIQNIYLETNYYFEGLSEVIGDFIMTSYFLPGELRAEQCNLYFFSDYAYQNEYFMNYINNVYMSSSYSFRVVQRNLIKDIDDNYLLSFYYKKTVKNLDWLNFSFISLAVVSLLASLYFFTKSNSSHFCTFFVLSFAFVPYLITKFIFTLTKNVSVFSETGTKNNLIILIIFTIAMFVFPSFKNRFALKNKTNLSNGDFYEVNI